MIKLSTIISEIKMLGKITPEMVHSLYIDIIYSEIDVKKKISIEILTKYNRGASSTTRQWIYSMDKNTLYSLYKDLLDLKSKHNIQEIQMRGTPSSDDIYALISQILLLIKHIPDWSLSWKKQKEFSNLLTIKYNRPTRSQLKDWIKTLSKSQLNQLLGDLLKFRDTLK